MKESVLRKINKGGFKKLIPVSFSFKIENFRSYIDNANVLCVILEESSFSEQRFCCSYRE